MHPSVQKWAFPTDEDDFLGMTLRDYFAAKAMQAAYVEQDWPYESTYREMAKHAYLMADAMLVARGT